MHDAEAQAPAYSFPRVSDGATTLSTPSNEKRPGPGAYNIRLEHRMEALLFEVGGICHDDSSSSSPRISPASFTAQLETESRDAPLSLCTVVGSANEFGLKFGDVPTHSTAPAFSFGSGDRQSRAKCYGTGDLNKEMSGRSSPGPITALQDMAKDSISTWDAPPNFSFGGKNVGRNKLLKSSCTMGPAQYGVVDSVGEQASSTCVSAPIVGFGSAERKKIDLQRNYSAKVADWVLI